MQKLISIDTQLCKTSHEWVLRFEMTRITFKGENAQEKLESFLRHLGNKSCN